MIACSPLHPRTGTVTRCFLWSNSCLHTCLLDFRHKPVHNCSNGRFPVALDDQFSVPESFDETDELTNCILKLSIFPGNAIAKGFCVTEVDLDLSRFSHCRTTKMRRISTLAQTTREASWHWRNVRDFMTLNFHRIFRFAWSIQNLGFMRSCTLHELILTSFNPLSFTKLLFRPGLVFTKSLPQLIFRAVSRTIEGLETVPQRSHRSRKHPGPVLKSLHFSLCFSIFYCSFFIFIFFNFI